MTVIIGEISKSHWVDARSTALVRTWVRRTTIFSTKLLTSIRNNRCLCSAKSSRGVKNKNRCRRPPAVWHRYRRFCEQSMP